MAYPLAQWREDTLSLLEAEDLLVPTRMHSADLYDLETLEPFLAQARTNDFKHDGLLSRVITVEMAMRSTGVCV